MTAPDLQALAFAHLASGRLAEAEAGFRRILADTPGPGPALHGRALWGLGLVAARAGRPDLAAGWLEEAARLLPDEAEIRLHLGQVRLDAGQPDRARTDLARALALVPVTFSAASNTVAISLLK